MALYLDTSCLLEVLFPEPETGRVLDLVADEDEVVVSTLARLETLVQIQARVVGGLLARSTARNLVARLETLLGQEPYELVRTPADVVDQAFLQVRALPKGYCPTLDRLHLAVMQSLEVHRPLTNDDAQARALGFAVTLPR